MMPMPIFKQSLRHCLIAGFLLASAPLTHAETSEEYVKLAEQAFEKADIVSAMNYYRKAADNGYAPAQNRLAYLLDNSEENEEAIVWYRKAAVQGDAEAQFNLARLYAAGEGTEKDTEQAYQLFTKSAEQLYAPAIRVLALANERGQLGQRTDYEKAQLWLQRGQQLNDFWSIKRLAKAYSEGDLGLRINKDKAKELEQLLEPLANSEQ